MRLAELSRRVSRRVSVCLRPWLANRLSLSGEVKRGAFMGSAGCIALAAVAGSSFLLAPIAIVGGGATGALIGLLLWCGSSDDQEPVVPPR